MYDSSWGAFVDDLRKSAAAMKRAPALPLTFLAILCFYNIPFAFKTSVLVLVTLGAAVAQAGFSGTLRVWFLRMFSGESSLRPVAIVRLSGLFTGRFLRLGVLAGVLAAIALAIGHGVAHQHSTATFEPTPVRVAILTFLLVSDIVLTFVTPALAFSTSSVREAFQFAVRTVIGHWRASLPYLVSPGLVLTGLAAVLGRSTVGPAGAVIVGIFGGMIGLWFKGATTAFYTRIWPDINRNEGAAYYVGV